jgi:hypothetical protein
MPTRPRERRLWTSLLFFLASLAAVPLFTSPVPAAEENRPAGIADLPAFRHQGVVLDYKDLKYNPCNDVIIPSVITTGQIQTPLGRYYMYCMYTNIGPRLNQKIALAVADADGRQSPQERRP